LVSRQQPLSAPLSLEQLAGDPVLVLFGRMGRARRFHPPSQFGLD